jgi:hypothetical protein
MQLPFFVCRFRLHTVLFYLAKCTTGYLIPNQPVSGGQRSRFSL